jgi:endonuclease G, mitochondrial
LHVAQSILGRLSIKKLLYLLVLLPLCAYAQNPTTIGPVKTSPHLAMGRPGVGISGNTLIARRGYACLHSTTYKTPLWVSYRLTKKDLQTSVPRKDSFKADPDLELGFRAELSDYINSGFDKGHMAPNRDMTRNTKTQAESFYLSNIIPQHPANNQRFWRAVEERFREYARAHGSLFIITGVIYSKPLPPGVSPLPKTIGENQVGVPTWLFKIAVRKLPSGRHEALAIRVPNIPISAKTTNYQDALKRALVSIDIIEKDAGLDFLNALPVAEQKRIESRAAKKLW